MTSKFEQLIEYVINDEEAKAKELFHDIVVEKSREILGYGSLLRKPECPFFTQRNIPEVNAIWIDEEHRRKGLGTALIKWIENLASQEGYNEIGIEVKRFTLSPICCKPLKKIIEELKITDIEENRYCKVKFFLFIRIFM